MTAQTKFCFPQMDSVNSEPLMWKKTGTAKHWPLLYRNRWKIRPAGTEASQSSCNSGYSDYLPASWTDPYRESWTLPGEIRYLVFLQGRE